jgi:putative ABC transport system permease protein
MKSNRLDSFIQPLEEIAFSKSFAGDDFPKRSKTILMALMTLAVVVLLMAWVNYVNLSFSRVTRRLKEFATRKANGAGTFDLVKQFLIESFIINALGVGVALTMLQIIRQPAAIYFNIHVGNLWSMTTETEIIFTLVILCGILLTGLYPALVGMANNPQTLFQMHATATNKKYLPSVLTTAQFTAAIALILWGVVIHQQLNHILNKETGLNRDGIIIVESPTLKSTNYQQEMDLLENQFADVPQVSGVSSSWKMIGDFGPGGGALRKIGEEHSIGLDANAVSEKFIPFFEIEILAGRNFITDDRKDVVLISRVTLNRLGFSTPEDAIGAKLEINLDGMSEWEAVEIVGVIEDYRIEPYFNADESNSQYAQGGEGRGILLSYKNKMSNDLLPEKIAHKIKAAQLDQLLPSLETAFKKIFPDDVFTWYFLDDYVNRVYINESITRNQILLFTILAIIISCLGL